MIYIICFILLLSACIAFGFWVYKHYNPYELVDKVETETKSNDTSIEKIENVRLFQVIDESENKELYLGKIKDNDRIIILKKKDGLYVKFTLPYEFEGFIERKDNGKDC